MLRRRSKAPVPVLMGLPRMSLAEGDVIMSVSPVSVASVRNLQVVSNDILRSGEALLLIPIRDRGRYSPPAVIASQIRERCLLSTPIP